MASVAGAAPGAPGAGAGGVAMTAPARGRTRTTLVTGPRAAVREAAIAAALSGAAGVVAAELPAAVILEGLADANSPLENAPETGLQVLRIAPGCLCCAGNLVLRVTLNRLLRRPPAQLFISLANAEHVHQLRSMLLAAPYGDLLDLAADLQAEA